MGQRCVLTPPGHRKKAAEEAAAAKKAAEEAATKKAAEKATAAQLTLVDVNPGVFQKHAHRAEAATEAVRMAQRAHCLSSALLHPLDGLLQTFP